MTVATLVDVLRRRGQEQATQQAFSFLVDGDVERRVHLSYGELDGRASRVAEFLKASGQPPHRPVLLFSPPGLEVIEALFGCFYSAAIAVVADFPQPRASLATVESIIDDAGVTVGLTARLADIEGYLARSEKLKRLRWLSLDEIVRSPLPRHTEAPGISPDSIAVLQYTSGSTGTPKGVMVSHANIVHNAAITKRRFGLSESTRSVFWVPPSHDMGLVGGVFQALYAGYPATFMPPLSFMQRPLRWLHAISTLRATGSAAPNFAFDLCVRKITPAQRDGLDLSSWTVAITGAEPVQPHTIERFSEFFAPCGFRPETFCPSYGLAEATLLVSGEKKNAPPTIGNPGRDRAALVGCGRIDPDHRVVIADPELRLPCQPGEIGEIWLAGGSVARGYWNRIEETETAFGAYLANTGEGPFLRTGDLGCVSDGELFVTGRLKDLIIVRGVNHSPYAIEQTVERCHPSLRPSSGAAFMVQADGAERLVVVHELERNFLRTVAPQDVFNAIRHAVAEEHGLEVQGIVLLRTASLPRTITGKTRRQSCRVNYLDGSLNAVARWSADASGRAETDKALVEAPPPVGTGREQAIQVWLVGKLSQRLNVPAGEIDVRRPFAEYGFDSAAVVGLAGDLQDHLGRELSPTLVYNYPNIELLCRYLAENAPVREAGESAAAL